MHVRWVRGHLYVKNAIISAVENHMVSPNVIKLLNAASLLNEQERLELLQNLENQPARIAKSDGQSQLRQALIDRGLLDKQPPRGKDMDRFRRWVPIPIQGKPLSQTIIEERR